MSDEPESVEQLDYPEKNVHEVADLVENIYSVEVLMRLREYEVANDDRKTAKASLDDRIEALEAANVASGTAQPADDRDADADVDVSDNTQADEAASGDSEDHRTLPRSAADPDTVVVRNPGKTALHLQGLAGTLAPGETREYTESDRLRQYIRENKLQVVRSN